MATTFFQKKTQINDLCKVLDSYLSKEEVEIARKAFIVAEKAHSGQFRKSGEEVYQSSIICCFNSCRAQTRSSLAS